MDKKQSNYRETERKRVIALLKNTNLFNSAESRRIITYKGKEYPKEEILLDGIHNIYKPIQDEVLLYFLKNNIDFWHTPKAKEPSNRPTGHILSSQVCCINHLFPIRHDKENVLKIAQTVCAEFIDVLPITTDKFSPGYILFEAVSDVDHLNEGTPTRGSNCTSVDALIYAVHQDGRKYLIPIEWKYTENYDDKDKSTGESGKTRLERYSELITESKFLKTPIKLKGSIYFYEPFYQLMRQTLWAEQMIKHHCTETIKAEDYIHVHIIPDENDELLYKNYKTTKKTLRESWLDNLKDREKYVIISPTDFMRNIDNNKYSDLVKYLQDRYWSGRIKYIENRYWKNDHITSDEYIRGCFEKFDNLSGVGMHVSELCSKLNEPCQYGGPMGLFASESLENEKEIVLIVDYAFLRNATAYAVFYDKKTHKITRKMPYNVFLKIYDSLLESGYSEVGGSWMAVFGKK
jgi:hypothetical protein